MPEWLRKHLQSWQQAGRIGGNDRAGPKAAVAGGLQPLIRCLQGIVGLK